MTASGLAAAHAIVDPFIDAHFAWLPRPTIQEDPDWTTAVYHATKDAIFIPHYTDSWREGQPEVLIHEVGHVVAWNSERPIEGFLAAMGADPSLLQHNLINEVFAEHFARAYVDGYDGRNYPQLINLVPFDAAKMRAFVEGLRPAPVTPRTPDTNATPEWRGPLPGSNFMPGRDGALIDRIVIHTTVGWASSAEARFRRASERVSAHFLVRLDGSVWQWVSTGDTAYHSGDWDMNLRSIGIEHEDGGAYDSPRPDALYTASASLVRDLCTTHGIPIDRVHVIGHREVIATACPDALDVDRIVREAGGKELTQDEFNAMANEWWRNHLDGDAFVETVIKQQAADAHHTHKTGEPEAA